jgi:hypothetical protein
MVARSGVVALTAAPSSASGADPLAPILAAVLAMEHCVAKSWIQARVNVLRVYLPPLPSAQ